MGGHLQGVEEIRTVVTSDPDLFCGFAFVHAVTLAGAALVVLYAQHDVREDGAAKETNDQIGEDNGVTCEKTGGLAGDVDIGADDAVEVTPADDNSNDHAALVHALDVVGAPRQRVSDSRVDADRSKERACVLHPRPIRRDQHDEADDGARHHRHIAVPSHPRAVCEPADENRHRRRTCIRRHRQQLRAGPCIPHSAKDCRQKQREGVQWTEAAHIDERIRPGLPVL